MINISLKAKTNQFIIILIYSNYFWIVIYKMDIRKIDALELLQSLDDKSVDLILTDPPYYKLSNIDWDKHGKQKRII